MPSTKPEQLLRFPLLCSIVLFLAPVPALGDLKNNTNCTVGDSPDGDAVSLVPTCSANTANLDVIFSESNDIDIRVRIDYVCIGNDNEKIEGTPWQRKFFSGPFRTTYIEDVGQLQPEMNCTFYVCYQRFTGRQPYIYGKGTASCITDIDECETANGGCEQTCNNTIGSFFCSCGVGYQLDGNGLNCTNIDECERGNTTNCHENAQCTDTEGSFICSCNPGYTGDGVNCTNVDECELGMHTCHSNANCTDTVGSFSCTCIDGFEGDGFNCTDVAECERDDLNNCHENAQCTDTEGSFNCSCNPGYTGDGLNCTNIDECELGMHTCDSNANCTDTVGSFSCTCIDGYEGDGFNCTALSLPGVRILPVVLVPTVLVVTILVLLCGVICVVYQFKKEVKFEKMFYKDEKIDLDFYPVSPFSVPKPAPSLVSVFDKLCTTPDSKPHFQDSDTDSDCQSEILETDPATKLMDNLVDNSSVGTDVETPENDDNCVANPPGQGYVASEAHQNKASVSSELFVETEDHVFLVFEESESLVLDLEEDAQNDDVWNSKMEPTIASKVVEKSSNYVPSDNLLVGSHESVSAPNLNDHCIPESDIPSNCAVRTNQQGYVDSEGCQTMTNVSTGIFLRTNDNFFPVSEEPVSLMLDFDEDGQNTKQSSSHGQVCPDSSASINCPSAIDQNDTIASNFVEQSSNYVRSEDLLEGSCESVSGFELNDHILESDIPSLDNCVVRTNERGYVDSEACQTMASVSLDIPAANCPSINQTDTIASNFVEQSSNYVRSEDLLEGSRGHVSGFNHIPETDIPSRVMSTNEHGYVDSEAHQNTTSASPEIFVRTEVPASVEPVSLVLDFDEDGQNTKSGIELSCYGQVCPDSSASTCPSAIDQNDTGASNFVEQSSNYIRREDLLESSCGHVSRFDLNDHLLEIQDIPSLDNCVVRTNERGYVDSEACQTMASVSLDIPAANCPSIDQTDTIASNSVEQSSNYVRSEDLLEGSRGFVPAFDHILESDIPSCVMSTNEHGYVDSEAHQNTTSVSPEIFVRTEVPASVEPVSLVLDFDEDGQNTKSGIELSCYGQVCPDSSASTCPSAIDWNDTIASNCVEQSSNYIRSEDLLEGSRGHVSGFDLNDHLLESQDIPSLNNCVVSANEQGYVDSEACQTMASVSLDIPAANCPSIDQTDTIASNSVEQSSNYVRSEDLLEGSRGFVPAFDHILESDIPSRVMSTNEHGYVDSEAHQNTTSVSPEIFVRTEVPASVEPVSLALDFDEDGQNTKSGIELSCYGQVCPDSSASTCPSAIDWNDTIASNCVEQSSNYIRSEDLLEGSRGHVSGFDLNDHLLESQDIPSLDNCVVSTNEQGYVDSEACQTMASVSLDIPAANSPSINQTYTIASNFVEQSSNYVRSEDLLEGVCGHVPAFDHIPESDILGLDNCIMTTNERGYVDSKACQNTASVSPELFIKRECEEGNFPASEEIVSLVLDLDEDSQNNSSKHESTFCDIPASSHSPEPAPHDHNETATSDYIRTEDLLVGRPGALTSAFDHISDSDSLQFICLEDAADQPSLSTTESKVEGYYALPKVSSSYVSDTLLLPSAKVRPDILCIQDLKASFIHSGAEDNLSNSTLSPQSVFSEHYRTLPHRNFGYSDDTAHNVSSHFTMQHPSTSSGYVSDYSTTGEVVPFSMVH